MNPISAFRNLASPQDFEIDPAVHASLLGAYWLLTLTDQLDDTRPRTTDTDPPWWSPDPVR